MYVHKIDDLIFKINYSTAKVQKKVNLKAFLLAINKKPVPSRILNLM